jgi:hypothetical protein
MCLCVIIFLKDTFSHNKYLVTFALVQYSKVSSLLAGFIQNVFTFL